ncbi:probable ubiquitin-like-specific protease 2B isoform X4 [Nicotiana tomentosiformis]|uniref:probable ubiquitin-like-specific protease 2B isoform X4 n=1 Tax=Nicotiana tomentosiformis TaxID=4098 RepID=UPI00051B10B5|nr:probable ubiquitin-like-specific protease 2B isoform X2 [Nicotiana tomentosiformis]
MKNPTDVFEFKVEEQPSETEANRFCSKYTFTQNGARGTNINSKETGDEPTVDMEAADGDFNGKSARSSLDAEDCSDERMLRLGGIPTITSTKQRRYPDREPNNCIDGSFLEGSSYTGTAFQMEYVQDESVGTDSDVDESRSDESASYSSATRDNYDILDGPLSNHQFDQWGMFENKPIVFCPDYLYYRGTSYAVTDTTVTFSSNCVEVKGSTMNGNSETSCIRFGVEDIFQIQSHLSGRFDVAVFKIHVNKRSTTQSENAHESSVLNVKGIEEVEFAVNDFDLSEKCEAIQSLDGYKAVWNYNEIEEWRENSHGETSNQQSKKYFPSYGEPLEEVYYPKGDPDAVCISKRDFDLLAPETFVNDTIIDFYIQYLKNGIPPEKRQRYHFFNCFFFRKLADMDKDPTSAFDGRAAFLRVRKWTRKVDLFDKDFVFIPVNYNYHWSLIVICHPGEVANFTDDDTAVGPVKVPCILHMDSFRGSHVGLKDLLQSYLWEEWKERTKETSDVVSSKFRNLRFLSLELPQQQNLSDCGLFLLHYVEHFLAEDPACISPYRIKNYHNEFLSVNWFQPHEPSIKRSAIQRLISNLLKNLSLENSPSCASDSCYPEDGLKTSNYDENAVELVSEQFGSSKSSDNLPCSQANEINPFPTSSLRGVCASDSGLVLNESFEPESDEESLLDMRFGHSASFNEFRSSLPPIQEEVEARDHLVYTSTETGLQHLGGSGSEPCALSYSSGSLTAEASWIPGVSVVEAVDEEDSSPTNSVHDSENPLEVEVVEPCRVDQNMNSDDKINHPKSASVNNIDCLVDGEATSGELLDITLAQCSAETHDNSDTGPVTSCQENLYDIHGNGNLACKRLLLMGSGPGSEADAQHNVKRIRLTPLDEGEVAFRSNLLDDLHL